MILRNLLNLLLIVSPLLTTAQKKITTIDIKDVVAAYVDRPGDLYILQEGNKVLKFDTLGMPVGELSFEQDITVFDPRDGARKFIYFNDNKLASFFSDETKKEIKIEAHYAIDPVLVSSSGDNQLWIVDKSDWSLKRVDPKQSKVVTESLIDQTQFSGSPKFIAIREYQNFLFLLEKNAGILIFNNLGKQIKKIGSQGIPYFNFLGEELYYQKDNKLIFYDLFDGSSHEMNIDPKAFFTLLTDARKYIVYKDKIDVFEN